MTHLTSRQPLVFSALTTLILLSGLVAAAAPLAAQDEPAVDPRLFQDMKWRLIGPFRGGRATAVTGVPGDPLTYYFGATGGGVWKTTDGGTTWANVSDGHFKTGTVGAVTVAASDSNVVYAGMGEAQIRGVTTSYGDGVYKSTDGGDTWTHLGLEHTRQISRVRVHPQNPDMVYVAAQGNPWTPTPERGIYRSVDGGLTWRQILFVDESTGASDLAMDPSNPRVLYAAFWQHRRFPWKVESGGPGSGIYKTVDGGETWTRLEKGLPETMGKIGIAVSATRPKRVWAIVEAEEGGLYRSDDGGKSWQLISDDRLLRARAWYYTKVFADPGDAETVYVLNAPMLRSIDGGKTWTRIPTPHGDNHDLWIAPEDPRRMINGNDGGANVSWNAGKTWTVQIGQPTGQFYRVTTDARFPYHVYGGQQDNSTVAIASRSAHGSIGREDWYDVGGCESAHIAFDPEGPDLVYAGCYQGIISEYEVALRRERGIMAYPYLGLGSDPRDLKYRFNWNAPIVVSPHDPQVIYHAGNMVLRSADRGVTWEEISPDLTRDDEDKQGPGGGPITNEAAGGETYNTIFYFVESPHEAGTFWAGTDDGFVHLSRDSGVTWRNVSPTGLDEAQVNAIEVSPHDPATAWLALTRYKFGDFSPLVYKTTDYGETWALLVDGIGVEAFVRVVREDPERRDLVFAGTERGLYVSFDGGVRWQEFQQNLPIVPITDLAIRDNDLVASTQGRAFWILDDLTPLHQIETGVDDGVTSIFLSKEDPSDRHLDSGDLFLFAPRPAYRVHWGGGDAPRGRGQNPPAGAILHYLLSEELAETLESSEDAALRLEILDGDEVIRTYSSRENEDEQAAIARLGFPRRSELPAKAGMNRFAWDLRRENVSHVDDLHVFYPASKSYRIAPGTFGLRLTASVPPPPSEDAAAKDATAEDTAVQPPVEEPVTTEIFGERQLEILPDPRLTATAADYAAQQRLIAAIWKRLEAIQTSVEHLRGVSEQVEDLIERTAELEAAAEIREAGEALVKRIQEWGEHLVQPRQKTFQDVINYPNRLNTQLFFLMSEVDSSDPPVTSGARQRFADLEDQWRDQAAEMYEILSVDVAAFNVLFDTHRIPAVIVPADL